MKTKTKAFINELLINPKISNTEAYMRTHQTTNRKSASVSASKLLAKPSVSIYMQEHVNSARKRIVELVDGAGKEEIQGNERTGNERTFLYRCYFVTVINLGPGKVVIRPFY